ncbi:hypothetical protein [Aliikangiella maris]|uniref:Uncharacterized protein n=2 Tax=Aliikangiella maris TaxID=3162458 RepID=A0ABV3MSC6_9GAMM
MVSNKFPGEALSTKGKVFGEVKVVNGKVTLGEGNVVPRDLDFVITNDRRLVVGSKHTTLANGEDVLAAGQMRLNGQGQIRRLDNLSGHYQPSVEEALRVPDMLRDMGLDVSGARHQLYRFKIDDDGWVVRSILDVNKTLD